MMLASGGTLLWRLAGLGLSLVTSVVLARAFAPDARGYLAVMMAVPGLIAIVATFGLETSNLYFAGRSPASHARVVMYSVRYSLLVGLVLTVVALAGAVVVPGLRLGLAPADFAISIALVTPVLAAALLTTSEAGRGRAVSASAVNVIPLVLYLVVTVLLTMAGYATVAAVFGVFALTRVMQTVWLLWRSRDVVGRGDDATSFRDYLGYAVGASAPTILMLLLLRIDVPIIQALAGPAQVGLWATATPMAEILLLIPTAINLVLLPRIAAGNQKAPAFLPLLRRTFIATMAGAIGIALLAPIAIPAMFGSRYAAATPILWLLLPGLVALATSRVVHIYLLAERRFMIPTASAATGLVVCVILELTFVPLYGAMAAATATTVAYLVVAAVTMAGALRRPPDEGADSLERSPDRGPVSDDL